MSQSAESYSTTFGSTLAFAEERYLAGDYDQAMSVFRELAGAGNSPIIMEAGGGSPLRQR